jgi:hypothetical protein
MKWRASKNARMWGGDYSRLAAASSFINMWDVTNRRPQIMTLSKRDRDKVERKHDCAHFTVLQRVLKFIVLE